MPLLFRLAAATFLLAGAARAGSFDDLRARIYAKPQLEFPGYPGLTASELAKAIAGMGEPISVRSRWTMATQTDVKPRGAKLLHPRGACADATWEIDTDTLYTGLFAKGTKIPAIVRMSSATRDSSYLKSKIRVFGMAVKVFPTQDRSKNVTTKNIFTLGEHGLQGTKRLTYIGGQPGDAPAHFTNISPPHGVKATVANNFFERFDNPSEHRPLYALAEVDQRGASIANARVPREVRFVPFRAPGVPAKADDDFRGELIQYKPGEFAFEIRLPIGLVFRRAGVLRIGQPVVSEFCDLELHFHHHPNRRELEKP